MAKKGLLGNIFDIALLIVAPEIAIVMKELKAVKGISKVALRAFEKDFKNLKSRIPALKGSKAQVKATKATIAKILNTDEVDA